MIFDLPFIKAHGLGNDFVIIFYDELWSKVFSWDDSRLMGTISQHLGNRTHGIGCDQILFIYENYGGSDPFIRFFNPDGSEAETCGNGLRCIGRLLLEKYHRSKLRLNTKTGSIYVATAPHINAIQVEMPWPRVDAKQVAQVKDFLNNNNNNFYDALLKQVQDILVIHIGNPHLVFLFDVETDVQLDKMTLTYGPGLERAPTFPLGINVNFAQYDAQGNITLSVWERGAGLTQACGSGACATSYGVHSHLKTVTHFNIIQKGGGLLIDIKPAHTPFTPPHLFMTGPAEIVYEGHFPLAALQNLTVVESIAS